MDLEVVWKVKDLEVLEVKDLEVWEVKDLEVKVWEVKVEAKVEAKEVKAKTTGALD